MDLFTTRTAIWLDPGQELLARDVAARAGLQVVAAGTPHAGRNAPAPGALAETLGAERPLSDIRSTLADAGAALDVRCVLILSRDGVTAAELPALAAAQSRRVLVAGLEPAPGRLGDLAAAPRPALARPFDACRPLARFRGVPAIRHVRDTLAAFGPIGSALVRCEGSGAEGSLGSRVMDALDLLHDLLGEPESVYAAATAPGEAGHESDLSRWTGDASLTARYADGAVAGVFASERGAWGREATLVGEGGVLRLTEGAFEWRGPGGDVRDSWTAPAHEAGAAAAIAASVMRMLDPHAPVEPPIDGESILAAAHAAVLSARTRSAESPATMRRMIRAE
jgi:hypothetical protein